MAALNRSEQLSQSTTSWGNLNLFRADGEIQAFPKVEKKKESLLENLKAHGLQEEHTVTS